MSAIAVGAAPPAAPSVAGAPSGVHVERKQFSSDGIGTETADLGIKWLLAWASDTVAPAAPDDAASDTASTSASTSASSAAPGAAPVAPPPPIETASDAAAADQPDDFDRLDVRLARLLHQQVVTPKETLKTAAARPASAAAVALPAAGGGGAGGPTPTMTRGKRERRAPPVYEAEAAPPPKQARLAAEEAQGRRRR